MFMRYKLSNVLSVVAVMLFVAVTNGYCQIRITDLSSQIHFGNDSTVRSRDSINIVVIHSNYYVGNDSLNVDSCIMQFRKYDVAAHYLIDREGKTYRLVPDEYTAWHAGPVVLPNHPEYKSVNRASIGIELINTPSLPPSEAQYRSLTILLRYLSLHYPIYYLTGHSAIAPHRKTDPWLFDWSRLNHFCPYVE